MNILNKLTKRNLSLNKKRTTMTIIGILLSTALIVCVSGLVTSFQKTLLLDVIKSDGYYHVMIDDMKKSDLEALKENRDIKDIYYTRFVGYSPFNSVNKFKPYLYVTAYDDKALNNLAVELKEGRLPQNKNEIVIPEHALENGGFNKKVGDEITLSLGLRYAKDDLSFPLTQKNPIENEDETIEITNYSGLETTSLKNEVFKEKEKRTYKIVGIIARPSYQIEEYIYPGYTCITYLEEMSDTGTAFILYKDPKKYEEKTENIVTDMYTYNYNSNYLRFLGVNDNPINKALYTVASVVLGIIILSSIFVIKNSFAISITEKYKTYGMFRSIGATSKQIKKNVLFEGFFLGLIAIPMGILCGIIAVVVLIFLINLILGDFLDGIKFIYSVPLIPILFSIILASITIYLSTIFIAIKAGKISPIDAIRGNNDIKIKSKKLKTPFIIKKLFKTGGVIAYKNLKRSKKKYRTTVISIVVSIFIFISLSSFIDFGFKLSGMFYKNIDYNMYFYSSSEIGKYSLDGFKEIANLDYVERYSILRMDTLEIDKKYSSDFGMEMREFYGMKENEINLMQVIALGEQEYNRYLKELGVKDTYGILIDEYNETINKKKYLGNVYNFKNNDKVEGINSHTKENFSMEIIKTSKRPMGLEKIFNLGGYLIISDKVFDKYFEDKHGIMYLKASDTKKLETIVDNLKKEKESLKAISYHNYEDQIKEQNALVLIVSIFLYGFITVISLIGITNIFNTITTNMNLRSKEFAMLKSVGMTKKEFNRMIRLESIFYGVKSLMIGIPLGLIGSYLIYLAFKEGLEFNYYLPIKSLIIVIIFVSLIIGIIMKYSLAKINKQNIIETIRNDNI